MSSSNNFYQKYNLSKAMDRFNNKIESKHAGGSKLFNHYRQFFDANVIEALRSSGGKMTQIIRTRDTRH